MAQSKGNTDQYASLANELQRKVNQLESRVQALETKIAQCPCCSGVSDKTPQRTAGRRHSNDEASRVKYESFNAIRSEQIQGNTTYRQTTPRVIPAQPNFSRESPARGITASTRSNPVTSDDRRDNLSDRRAETVNSEIRSTSTERNRERGQYRTASAQAQPSQTSATVGSGRNISPSKGVRFENATHQQQSQTTTSSNDQSRHQQVAPHQTTNQSITPNTSVNTQIAPRRNSPMNKSLQIPATRPQPHLVSSPQNVSTVSASNSSRPPSSNYAPAVSSGNNYVQSSVTTVQPPQTATFSRQISNSQRHTEIIRQTAINNHSQQVNSNHKDLNIQKNDENTTKANNNSSGGPTKFTSSTFTQQRPQVSANATNQVYTRTAYSEGEVSPGKVSGPGTNRPATDFRNPSQDADEYYGNPTGRRRCESEPRVTAEETFLDMPSNATIGRVRQPNEPSHEDGATPSGKSLPGVQASFQPPATARPLPQAATAEGINRAVFVGSNDLPRRKSGTKHQTVR